MVDDKSHERTRRRPGTPSPVSDLRGGPGTASGVDYQTLVAMQQTLELLDNSRYEPSDCTTLRFEPRTIDDGKQLGYDVGWDGSRRRDPETWEIKFNPTAADVREYVARLPARVGRQAPRVRFVYGNDTAASKSLEALFFHAGEASDNDEFRALVDQAGHDGEAALLELLGDDPMAVMECGVPPEYIAERQAVQAVDMLCQHVCMPRRRDELRAAVRDVVTAATRRRGSLSVGALRDQLRGDRLLMDAAAVDVSGVEDEVIAAVVVLERCPLPLPVTVLADALSQEPEAVVRLLSDLADIGRVRIRDGTVWLVDRPPVQLPFDPGADAAVSALRALIGLAVERPVDAAGHTPNARGLADAAVNHAPEVVAEVFVAFDKPSKAYGDLSLVYRLAQTSTKAVLSLVDSGRSGDRHLMRLRARNYICGEAWVLQRRDELGEAAELLAEARRLTELSGDRSGLAWSDKCEGRLARMRAEKENSDERRADLLRESERLLRDATTRFAAMASDDASLYEEAGESLSLLARTFLVAGDLIQAADSAAGAHSYLDASPASKAYADLVLVDAEIAVTRTEGRGGGADLGALDGHVAAVRDVVDRFSMADASDDLAASEIVSRAHFVAGRLYIRLEDIPAALDSFEAAERVNRELQYYDRAYEAGWAAKQLVPGAVPSPLAAALSAASADAATSHQALHRLETWCGEQGHGMTNADAVYPADHPWWTTLVIEAERQVASARPRWREGRVLA